MEQLDEEAGRECASARLLQDPLLDHRIRHDHAGELVERLLRFTQPTRRAAARLAEIPRVLPRESHTTNLSRFSQGACPAMLNRIDLMRQTPCTRRITTPTSAAQTATAESCER